MGYQSVFVRALPGIILVLLAACTSVRPLPKLARQYHLPASLPKKKVGLVDIYIQDSLAHVPAKTDIRTRTKLKCIPFIPLYFLWDEKRTFSMSFGRDKLWPSLGGYLTSSVADALHRQGLDTSLGAGRLELLVDSVRLHLAFSQRDAWGMVGLFAAELGGKQSEVGPATYKLAIRYRFASAVGGNVYEGARHQSDSIFKRPVIQHLHHQSYVLKDYITLVSKGYRAGIDSLAVSLVADLRRQANR